MKPECEAGHEQPLKGLQNQKEVPLLSGAQGMQCAPFITLCSLEPGHTILLGDYSSFFSIDIFSIDF